MKIKVDKEPYKDNESGKVDCIFRTMANGENCCMLEPTILNFIGGGIKFEKCQCEDLGCPKLQCENGVIDFSALTEIAKDLKNEQ